MITQDEMIADLLERTEAKVQLNQAISDLKAKGVELRLQHGVSQLWCSVIQIELTPIGRALSYDELEALGKEAVKPLSDMVTKGMIICAYPLGYRAGALEHKYHQVCISTDHGRAELIKLTEPRLLIGVNETGHLVIVGKEQHLPSTEADVRSIAFEIREWLALRRIEIGSGDAWGIALES